MCKKGFYRMFSTDTESNRCLHWPGVQSPVGANMLIWTGSRGWQTFHLCLHVFFLLRSVWWYSKAIPCDMFHWGRLVLCSGANLVSPKLDDWTLNNKASPISSCTRFNCCWTLLFNPFHLASVRTPSMQLYSELRRSSQVDQAASAGIRPSWSKLSIFKESMNSVAT